MTNDEHLNSERTFSVVIPPSLIEAIRGRNRVRDIMTGAFIGMTLTFSILLVIATLAGRS